VFFVFPAWTNRLREVAAGAVVLGGAYLTLIGAWVISPATTAVGYMPEQPVPYSHRLHAGELGIDCRYCHSTVEETARASLPPASVCMNCHAMIRTESAALAQVRASFEGSEPLRWVRVHDLPDFVYFNHSAHVNAGVGCVSCHGRVDRMEVVRQVEPLSMGWCLECHRDAAPRLRPPDRITDLAWAPAVDDPEMAAELAREYAITPSTDCFTCHR
jgi:hypothetical protein